MLPSILKSQYHAALAMLRDAIEKCPEKEWLATERTPNAFWQVAYHALFFAHFYLMPDHEHFTPWHGHQRDNQNPDGLPGEPDPASALPLIPTPYTKEQVLEYWSICDGMVDSAVDALDLASEQSGFPWYPISKLEHQLVNIRHIQHHTAQLADRLRTAANVGVTWVGARHK